MSITQVRDQPCMLLSGRIVATALTLGLPLITADSTITGSGLVPIVR